MNTASEPPQYPHLGSFSDFVAVARTLRPLFPPAPPGPETRRLAAEVLRFTVGDEMPRDVQTAGTWVADGVRGEKVTWLVGYGPRTHAWVLSPDKTQGPLPGIVALHDHGHYKFYGREKIADGPDGPLAALSSFRETYYGGRAYANALAREGFVVLVHDVFLWGSRKFPLEVMPERELLLAQPVGETLEQDDVEEDIRRYNGAAYLHEHLAAKYCTVLGTNLSAVAAYEDRVALNYLRCRNDVDGGRVGCIGLSGGGLRASLLRATSDHLQACAIVGMMSTYEGLLGNCIAPHTWMLFPAGWSAHGDWPDLASCAAPAPLLVQFLQDDAQFTLEGMQAADSRMAAGYLRSGASGAYTGQFYPGPHRFDLLMQEKAFSWLGNWAAHGAAKGIS
jgi:dienelactone hydrolase